MNVFLALDIHAFSQTALGQNLTLYMFVSSVERVMKSIREFFLALGIPLCPTIKIDEILFYSKLTLGPIPSAYSLYPLTARMLDLVRVWASSPCPSSSLAILLKIKMKIIWSSVFPSPRNLWLAFHRYRQKPNRIVT